MFIKKSFVDEIAGAMERQLVDGAINKQAEVEERLVKAANYLNAAAEIFDESGLSVQAELITAVLESLAAKKSKKKKIKPKAKAKKVAPKKAPSSEKMVKNLKEKGWVFDESGANDQHCADDNCAMCGDMSYAKDEGYDEDNVWHLESPDDPNHTSRFWGSKARLKKRLDEVMKENGIKWKVHGPYKNHDELDKKHFPHWFHKDKDISSAKDTVEDTASDEELLSMLDDFKNHSEGNDFEDEMDLHNPDTLSEEAYHPDFKMRDFQLEDPEYSGDYGEPYDPVYEKYDRERVPNKRYKEIRHMPSRYDDD